MSLKRTGSNVSTSGPAPRKKNARVSGRVDSDVVLFDAQGEEFEDDEFMADFTGGNVSAIQVDAPSGSTTIPSTLTAKSALKKARTGAKEITVFDSGGRDADADEFVGEDDAEVDLMPEAAAAQLEFGKEKAVDALAGTWFRQFEHMSSWAYACRQDLQGSSFPATQLRSVKVERRPAGLRCEAQAEDTCLGQRSADWEQRWTSAASSAVDNRLEEEEQTRRRSR